MADAAAAATAPPHASVHPTPPAGLSSAEVAERRSRGLANGSTERTSRSVAEILRANILTRFNFILGALLAVIYVTWVIVPLAVLLLASQLHARDTVKEALTGTVAALVGVVPQGLVLLTSVAFGVAAVTLARRHVLVQQLPAVEGLARVDVLCIDKTGTLTDGSIAFDSLIPLGGQAPVAEALGALGADEASNATLRAIGQAFPQPDGWERTASVPFSSARKWSAASFAAHGTWVLGAPEMVLPSGQHAELSRAAELAAGGHRVLALAHAEGPLLGESLPPSPQAAALIALTERLRPDAAETLGYFAAQGVALKVLSGDSPRTVAAVAARAGLPGSGTPVDARDLSEDLEALGHTLEEHAVFGRVTPHQKQAMVKALQARGHTVAMTGDGVNDVLALKLADLGIAMGSGAAATRAVAELVLLDGRFATLPGVVAEGRRVTANIERVANLFVTKTVWAALLGIAVGVTLLPYPFLPRHLTIIDTLTIGIPSFFLALAPNLRRYIPGFVNRVFRFTIPAGTVAAVATFAAFALARFDDLPLTQQRTAATLVMLMMSLTVLVILAQPLTWRRIVLVGLMIAGFVLLFPIPSVRDFYDLRLPNDVLVGTLVIGFAGVAVLAGGWEVSRRLGRGPAAAVQAGTAGMVTASRAA